MKMRAHPSFDGVAERNLLEVWRERISEWKEHAARKVRKARARDLSTGRGCL